MDLDVLWAVVGSATRWRSFPHAEHSGREATLLPSPVLAEIAYRVFGIVRDVVGPARQRERLEMLAREALRRVRLGHSHLAFEARLELRQHVVARASAWLSPTDANELEAALAPVHQDTAECEASHLVSPEGRRLDGVRILVVDDEPDSLELMRIVFELCGADVATASSADGALALFAESGADVLVSDLAMPGHDGYWLVHQVLNTAQRTAHRVAALAVTGKSQREHPRLAPGAGFRDYLVKPIEPDELCRRVGALVA
jgi:CheY-like chemotaxis protein